MDIQLVNPGGVGGGAEPEGWGCFLACLGICVLGCAGGCAIFGGGPSFYIAVGGHTTVDILLDPAPAC